MDWARSRRWTVIGILTAAVAAFLLILAFAIFYKTPTCFDQKQNGRESGVDCGGTCSTLCSAEAQKASIRFARTLSQSGRSDLIAYIDNPNTDAYAKDARLTIDIYREDGHTLQKHVLVTLPAKSSTPLFIPGIASDAVQQAFVSFDAGHPQWVRGQGWEGGAPKASNISIENLGNGQRVTATIVNQTAYPVRSLPVIATVFAADGSVIAASQTVISTLPAQGSAQAVFTWNEVFAAVPTRVEVVPLLALPRLVP